MSYDVELYASAVSLYEEAMELDISVQSKLKSMSPEEILTLIPMDKLIDCYDSQMDYDGKTHVLQRISEINEDIAKIVLLDNFEFECEQFANYMDHDYEIEFLMFLHDFDNTLFNACVKTKLRQSSTPSYAMYIIGSVLSSWTREHIRLLILRVIELDDIKGVSEIVSHLSDYEDDLKRSIIDLHSEFKKNLHPSINKLSLEKITKVFIEEFEQQHIQ